MSGTDGRGSATTGGKELKSEEYVMVINLPDWLAPYAQAVLDRPAWQAGLYGLLIGWFICPVYMYLLALTELRWPRYHEQFKAFMPGNLFLGVCFGTSCYLASRAQKFGSGNFVHVAETWWLNVAVVFSIGLTAVLWLLDIVGMFQHNKYPHRTYSWRQIITWTKVYHNTFVYGVYSLLLVALGVPGLVLAPIEPVDVGARLLLIMALACWVTALGIDAKQPMHSTGHIELRGFGGVVRWVLGLVYIAITVAAVAALPVG